MVLSFALSSCSTLASTSKPTIQQYSIGFEKTGDFALFEIKQGAMLSDEENWSNVLIDNTNSFTGSSSIMLSADKDTKRFRIVGIYLPLEKASYKYSCYVKGNGIKLDGKQYNNAYTGLFIRYMDGKKKFVVNQNNGTFNWRKVKGGIRIIDTKGIESIQFAIFLSKSGTLWVDDIDLTVE
jgi:hypothetical protein